MALNLTVLAEPGNSHFLAVSGSIGCANEKGPLIAGFLVKCSHFPIIDPFDEIARIRCQKGPDPGVKGSGSGSIRVKRVHNTVHLRPWEP